MRNGTQEELDAAKDDATLLPMDARFVTNTTCQMINAGVIVFRGAWVDGKEVGDLSGNSDAVAFSLDDKSDYEYVDASELEVIA